MPCTEPTPWARRALVCAVALFSTTGAAFVTAPSAVADFPTSNRSFHIKTVEGRCLKHEGRQLAGARSCMIGSADHAFYRYVKSDGVASVRTEPNNGRCVSRMGLLSDAVCDLVDSGDPRAVAAAGFKHRSDGRITDAEGERVWNLNRQGHFSITPSHISEGEVFTFGEY